MVALQKINGKGLMKLTVFFIITFLFTTCEFDKGIAPLTTGISGKITYFDPGNRPSDVDEVRLAALRNIPPSSLGDVFFSEPLDYNPEPDSTGAISIEYDLAMPPGDYPGIVLLWKPKNSSWSFDGLMGVYGVSLIPTPTIDVFPVNITREQGVIENVDFLGLWLFANPDGKIRGDITYLGAPPSDTQVVILVTLDQKPASGSIQRFDTFIELFPVLNPLNLASLPFPVATSKSDYQLDVSSLFNRFPINIKFIGLFWKGFDTSFEDMKLIGFYPDSADANQAGTVIVPESESIPNINFTADFNF